MSDDEIQIRHLVQQWHAATKAGDTPAVLALMTDDAMFLTAGHDPMDKSDFAAASAPESGGPSPQLDIQQAIHEIEVAGPLAFMRSSLTVTMTPPGATSATERAGQTLTVFRKVAGRWLLARDANLLVPKDPPSGSSRGA